MAKKILYIVLDGLSDEPVEELNNKTPLEAAVTTCLGRLAQTGKTGLVYPLKKGVVPDSDTAVIGLLGYDPYKYYTGRGPLESFAAGLKVNDGDVALRINFATCAADGVTIEDRRVARSLEAEEAEALAKEINSKVTLSQATFEFKNTVGHRGVLVIRGMRSKLSGAISNTDPAHVREGVFSNPKENFENVIVKSVPLPGFEDSVEAKITAELVNEFTEASKRVLENSALNKKRVAEKKLPANLILCRDAGDRLPKFPDINALYDLKFGCFVEMPVERAIALLTGMEIIEVPSSSGHLDVDYPVWAKIALDALTEYDGIYVHLKGPDESAHDGNYLKKKEIIEAIDKFFFASLLPKLDVANTIIAVTTDHCTSSISKTHCAGPVPLVISGANTLPDGSLEFSEKAAKLGALGEINGQEILPLLVKSVKT
ncbi:MAG: alkaline phosphatase family protein [Candidatus Omnitrophica bacterium]|nr:alkaline phosphatase family protein [Candidatus Omnitrophota bacterium]MDD5653313.1 alkaline phosphatase family protein [Candidatus Omnitrophota bacterium]